jgi:TolB-like protein/DNA-binding SARP family transcriptional activator/Flp pilus assembly protein TadD
LYLKLFGGIALERAGRPVVGRASQRHRLGLLALLAASGSGGVSRDRLILHLWPEVDTERGRHLLSNCLYVLRQALGEEALPTSADAVRLDPDRVRSDVREFEEALARGDFATAVALYAGPFLDGFFLSEAVEFEQWVDRERRRLAADHARALEALAESAEAKHDFARAADWWKRRSALDPLDSRVALRLMQALDAGGNRAAALQQAAVHERLLREELDIGPAAEVVAFAERLRRDPPVAAVTTRDSPPGLASRTTSVSVGEPVVGERAAGDTAAAAPSRAQRPWGWRATVALVAVVAVGAAAWRMWPRAPALERSLVVLPFVDLSGDRQQEYFADGLTEEIITRLAAVPELKVISRTSAMHYKGTAAPLRRIAEELGVAHVVEGSVRHDAGRLRVTAQLIDARTDVHRWAATYDAEPRDVFQVQERIAREIVRVMQVELGSRGERRMARRGTHDAEAYDLYRRGRHFWSMRTPEGHQKAVAYYRQAIARDSTYAEPYAGLADTYLTDFQLGISGMAESDAYSRYGWAAERALALDDQSSEAHASAAILRWWRRDWPGAAREFRRAIELNPGNADARTWYALLLAGLGRVDDALDESRRAVELDPFAVIVSITLAWNHYLARDYDSAVRQYHRTLDVSRDWIPAHSQLGVVLALQGKHDEALRESMRAAELAPRSQSVLADLAFVHAKAGRSDEARRLLARLGAASGGEFHVARPHAALGQPDSAFVWLDRSAWQWPHRAARADPALDPLRGDPRFAHVSERVDRAMGVR